MARISEEEYRDIEARIQKRKQATEPEKRSKYGNREKVVNGITFQSTKEARRYQDLLIQYQVGDIKDLRTQHEFEIWVNDQHICSYFADFTYYRDGEFVVEDVKSKITRKKETYRLKFKLMMAVRGIEIQEI